MGMTAATGMMILGGGIQAKGYRQTGKSQEALGNYNADIAELQAQDAVARGRETETRSRFATKQAIGSQRAAFAASNVDIGDPDSTAVNVFANTAALGELDALTIRSNAAREAWGYRMQEQDYRARGQIAAQEGENKAIGALVSTAGSVLYGKYGFGATGRGRSA